MPQRYVSQIVSMATKELIRFDHLDAKRRDADSPIRLVIWIQMVPPVSKRRQITTVAMQWGF